MVTKRPYSATSEAADNASHHSQGPNATKGKAAAQPADVQTLTKQSGSVPTAPDTAHGTADPAERSAKRQKQQQKQKQSRTPDAAGESKAKPKRGCRAGKRKQKRKDRDQTAENPDESGDPSAPAIATAKDRPSAATVRNDQVNGRSNSPSSDEASSTGLHYEDTFNGFSSDTSQTTPERAGRGPVNAQSPTSRDQVWPADQREADGIEEDGATFPMQGTPAEPTSRGIGSHGQDGVQPSFAERLRGARLTKAQLDDLKIPTAPPYMISNLANRAPSTKPSLVPASQRPPAPDSRTTAGAGSHDNTRTAVSRLLDASRDSLSTKIRRHRELSTRDTSHVQRPGPLLSVKVKPAADDQQLLQGKPPPPTASEKWLKRASYSELCDWQENDPDFWERENLLRLKNLRCRTDDSSNPDSSDDSSTSDSSDADEPSTVHDQLADENDEQFQHIDDILSPHLPVGQVGLNHQLVPDEVLDMTTQHSTGAAYAFRGHISNGNRSVSAVEDDDAADKPDDNDAEDRTAFPDSVASGDDSEISPSMKRRPERAATRNLIEESLATAHDPDASHRVISKPRRHAASFARDAESSASGRSEHTGKATRKHRSLDAIISNLRPVLYDDGFDTGDRILEVEIDPFEGDGDFFEGVPSPSAGPQLSSLPFIPDALTGNSHRPQLSRRPLPAASVAPTASSADNQSIEVDRTDRVARPVSRSVFQPAQSEQPRRPMRSSTGSESTTSNARVAEGSLIQTRHSFTRTQSNGSNDNSLDRVRGTGSSRMNIAVTAASPAAGSRQQSRLKRDVSDRVSAKCLQFWFKREFTIYQCQVIAFQFLELLMPLRTATRNIKLLPWATGHPEAAAAQADNIRAILDDVGCFTAFMEGPKTSLRNSVEMARIPVSLMPIQIGVRCSCGKFHTGGKIRWDRVLSQGLGQYDIDGLADDRLQLSHLCGHDCCLLHVVAEDAAANTSRKECHAMFKKYILKNRRERFFVDWECQHDPPCEFTEPDFPKITKQLVDYHRDGGKADGEVHPCPVDGCDKRCLTEHEKIMHVTNDHAAAEMPIVISELLYECGCGSILKGKDSIEVCPPYPPLRLTANSHRITSN